MISFNSMQKQQIKNSFYELIFFVISIIGYIFSIDVKNESWEIVFGICAAVLAISIGQKSSWRPRKMGGSFSWEFFKSLPLNKPQLIKLCVSLFVVDLFPTLYFFGLFISQDMKLGVQNIWLNAILIIPTVFLATMYFAYFIIKANINFNRKVFQKINFKQKLLNSIRNTGKYILFLPLFLLFAITLASLQSKTDNEILPLIFINILLVIMYFFEKKSTLSIFHQYKKSYISPHFHFIKDSFYSAVTIGLIAGIVFLARPYNPESNDYISKLVKSKNYRQLMKIPNQSKDINLTNEHGFNPYMMAVAKGDIRALKILKSKGAVGSLAYTGSRCRGNCHIKSINDYLLALAYGNYDIAEYILSKNPSKIYSKSKETQYNALHISAMGCRQSQILENLISKNLLNVNTQNKNGETPLHLAAKKGCLTNMISLIEAGAKLDIKTTKNKLVKDYIRKGSKGQEIRNYLSRLERNPASFKKHLKK